MRKRLYLVLLVIGAVVTGIMGCFMNKEDDKKQLLTYMQNKYKEEFVYRETYAGQLGKEYTAIVAESRKYPERKAIVRVTRIDGQKCFQDNYPAYLLQEEIEREMEELAKECFGNCRAIYQIPLFVFPEDFGPDMTASEFLSDVGAGVEILLIPEEHLYEKAVWEQKLDCFRKCNLKKGYRVRGTVKCMESQLIFSMDKKGNFGYMRWLSPQREGER